MALENAEQKSNSFIGYPLLIGVITVTCVMETNTVDSYETMIMYYVFLVLFFVGMMFISERGIKFNKRKIIVFICSILIGFIIPTTFMKSEGFGTFRNYPGVKGVENINISIGYYNAEYENINYYKFVSKLDEQGIPSVSFDKEYKEIIGLHDFGVDCLINEDIFDKRAKQMATISIQYKLKGETEWLFYMYKIPVEKAVEIVSNDNSFESTTITESDNVELYIESLEKDIVDSSVQNIEGDPLIRVWCAKASFSFFIKAMNIVCF